MEIEQIKVNGDERLVDALKSKGYTDIPSNVILDKTLTGIGATYAELHSCRNSIIIEPNVPVIVGKTAKNGDWLAVYSNTTVAQIKKYLKRTDVDGRSAGCGMFNMSLSMKEKKKILFV